MSSKYPLMKEELFGIQDGLLKLPTELIPALQGRIQEDYVLDDGRIYSIQDHKRIYPHPELPYRYVLHCEECAETKRKKIFGPFRWFGANPHIVLEGFSTAYAKPRLVTVLEVVSPNTLTIMDDETGDLFESSRFLTPLGSRDLDAFHNGSELDLVVRSWKTAAGSLLWAILDCKQKQIKKHDYYLLQSERNVISISSSTHHVARI